MTSAREPYCPACRGHGTDEHECGKVSPAREQAQVAAHGRYWKEAADLASDVWEPLLKDVVELHAFDIAGVPPPERLREAWKRAREAIGE